MVTLRLSLWDNQHWCSCRRRTRNADAARNGRTSGKRLSLMSNELEFAYAPVRDKVRDLREYL